MSDSIHDLGEKPRNSFNSGPISTSEAANRMKQLGLRSIDDLEDTNMDGETKQTETIEPESAWTRQHIGARTTSKPCVKLRFRDGGKTVVADFNKQAQEMLGDSRYDLAFHSDGNRVAFWKVTGETEGILIKSESRAVGKALLGKGFDTLKAYELFKSDGMTTVALDRVIG